MKKDNVFMHYTNGDTMTMNYSVLNASEAKPSKTEKPRMLETKNFGNKTSSGEIGLKIRTLASPKVGQDQGSGVVNIFCWLECMIQPLDYPRVCIRYHFLAVNGAQIACPINSEELRYDKRLILRCIHHVHHFDSDLINRQTTVSPGYPVLNVKIFNTQNICLPSKSVCSGRFKEVKLSNFL